MAEILIIGGGVSGLSAGIYGLLSGHDVTVCEKNPLPGGNLTGWYRGDYYIDNCIHWLTGTNPNTEMYGMWKTLGVLGSAGVYQPDSLYTCECCGITLSLYRDIDKFEREMLKLSPADEKAIRSLIKAVKAVQYAEGIGGPDHNEKCNAIKRAASLRLLYKYYTITAGELADSFRHPLIKKFISSFLSENFGSVALLYVFAEFCGDNAGYPRGGSLAAAKRMAKRFKELGGRLLLNKEAVKINTENGRVVSVITSDNDVLTADWFVSAADPYYVFEHLLNLPLPEELEKIDTDIRYERFSSCHAAFTFDGMTPPFSYDAIIDVPRIYRRELGSDTMALREFSFEPSFAPEGKTVIQTTVFCHERESLDFVLLKNDAEQYKRKKESIAHCMKKSAENVFPSLKNKLSLLDVWTPATYRDYFNSAAGSYMSHAFTSGAVPNFTDNKVKEISNLILATQWLRAPGGLPNAAESGKRAIETINAAAGAGRRKIAAVKYGEAAAASFKS